MKISKSKQELASIIRENGGWRDGAEFSAQDGDGSVGGYGVKPEWNYSSQYWWRDSLGGWFYAGKIKNHHQTILSREEYLRLYPAPDAELVAMCDGVTEENKHQEYCESVMRSIPEPSDRPTIEQLASDYQNRKAYADRKREEADAAKADAEAKLAELVAAGKEFGFVLSVAPVQKYTGTFYNAELGEAPPYGKNTRDAVCDGCGKRYGEHYGDRCKSCGER